MTTSAAVIVVGAGVVGCATAYFLARQGAKVLVLDKDAIGSGASFHATGLLTPWRAHTAPAVSEIFETSLKLSRELMPRLKDETGIDFLYQVGEGLRVALREEQMEQGKALASRPGMAGTKVVFVDGDEARKMEPRLSPNVLGALWASEHGQVDSYRYTLALARGAEEAGAAFLTRQVIALECRGERVTGVVTPSGIFASEMVVLAMGAWSAEAEEWLNISIPVRPQKGQNMRLRWDGEPLRYLMGQVGWGHLIQRADGFLSVGSTEEEGLGTDTTPTTEARHHLVEHALSVMPCLETAEIVQQFAGPRPQSQDNLPIMGPVHTLSGVYLNTGHGHSGIILAAASARHVAELVLMGRSSILPVAPYLASRFSTLGAS